AARKPGRGFCPASGDRFSIPACDRPGHGADGGVAPGECREWGAWVPLPPRVSAMPSRVRSAHARTTVPTFTRFTEPPKSSRVRRVNLSVDRRGGRPGRRAAGWRALGGGFIYTGATLTLGRCSVTARKSPGFFAGVRGMTKRERLVPGEPLTGGGATGARFV